MAARLIDEARSASTSRSTSVVDRWTAPGSVEAVRVTRYVLAAQSRRPRDRKLIQDTAVSTTSHTLNGMGRGGQPINFDRDLYKHRNVIERAFSTFKQWRGIASRYDKLAVNDQGSALPRAIVIWATESCGIALTPGRP